MRSARPGLLSSVVMALVVMAGCTDGADSADTAAPSAGGDAAATASGSAPSAVPGLDAATKTACATMSADIKTILAKVAKAEKIGPPAGHSAVSAQYSAGAAGFYAHTFTTSDTVNDAAKQVATAMSGLADKYASAPTDKPSRTALDAAIKQLTAACTN